MNQIPQIRLFTHHLACSSLTAPAAVVSRMGAMQAQDFGMAKWAVGIRLPGSTDSSVEEAFNRGELLRTHVMRPTWHFVTPADIRWMLSLSSERIKASAKSRDRALDISEALYATTNRVIEKALCGRQLTREALGKELEKAKIAVDASRLTHFIMRAEVEGMICSGALQGKKHTYALLDERVPPTKPLPREEAAARLAHTYFSSHGPATLQDFVWWSGLSVTEAKRALEAVKQDFITENIDGAVYRIPRTSHSLPDTATPLAWLLPAYDEYIISYKDRRAVLQSEVHSKAVSSNGVFRPTVVVNGQVIGTWKKATAGNSVALPDYFSPPKDGVKSLVAQSLRVFGKFIRPETQ